MNFNVNIKRDGPNYLFINIRDKGYEVVDSFEKITNPQIVIKNGDEYIVSKEPLISLKVPSLEAVDIIQKMLKSLYRDALFIDNYFYEKQHYLIAIYKKTLQRLQDGGHR